MLHPRYLGLCIVLSCAGCMQARQEAKPTTVANEPREQVLTDAHDKGAMLGYPWELSLDRIQAKQEQYRRWAAVSRWVWRSTEGVTAAGAIAALAVYCYNQQPSQSMDSNSTSNDSSTVSDSSQQTHDGDPTVSNNSQQSHADTLANVQQKLNRTDKDIAILKKRTGVSQQAHAFGKSGWLPKMRDLGQAALDSVRHNVYRASLFAAAVAPGYLYQKLVRPIYLTDITGFMQSYTKFHHVMMHMSCLAQNDFAAFQRQRYQLVGDMIYDIESILAFLASAQEYLSDDMYQRIGWIYDDIEKQMNTFLISVYADTQDVVTAAINQLQKQISAETTMYQQLLMRQDVTDWVTSL